MKLRPVKSPFGRTRTGSARPDLIDEEAATFEVVLAAPHSRSRKQEDQTTRMLTAVRHPRVRILAHPRGRITGSYGGVVADCDAVFAAAAECSVAIEIDGDPARQDLDYVLARRAYEAGCLFALDSDGHTVGQLFYADTALAHARLAGIPSRRIINCWPVDDLRVWLSDRLVTASGIPFAAGEAGGIRGQTNSNQGSSARRR